MIQRGMERRVGVMRKKLWKKGVFEVRRNEEKEEEWKEVRRGKKSSGK